MIRFVPKSVILKIHADQIARFGGAPGLRDEFLLDSALHMPQAQFGGEFLHPSLHEMAAAYGFHLSKNHPFVDGNKRTAYAVMLAFLRFNAFDFLENDTEHYAVMMAVTNGKMSKQELSVWLKKIITPL